MKSCMVCGKNLCKENKTGYCRGCSNKRPEIREKNSAGVRKAHKDGTIPSFTKEAQEKSRKSYLENSYRKFLENPDRAYPSETIRTHLLFSGREYKCEECGIVSWRGKDIQLEAHHLDGNHCNNRLDNLKFLCPNCHSQTVSFRGRNINTGRPKLSDAELLAKYEEYMKENRSVNSLFKDAGLASSGNYKRLYRLLIKLQK